MVINKDYRKGQLSSLIAALEQVPPETEAILICLVDNPFITTTIVDQIVSAFRQTKGAIVVPVFNNKRGHPALFAKSLFKELANAPPQQGARYVVYSNEDKVVEVETTERAVLIHIDAPEDYKSYFGTDP